jgi:ribosomal protein S18 acetylase RimI-like enzyme
MGREEMQLRRLTSEDVPEVAALHLKAFPQFFLSSLGERFLREFYWGLSADPASICYVAKVDGKLGGFVAGSAQPGGTYRRLVKARFLKLFVATGLAVIRRPLIGLRLVRTFAARTSSAGQKDTAELMSIAVDPAQQGRSIGQALIVEFVGAAGRAGSRRIVLTTDRAQNSRVNAFYALQGFRLRQWFTTREGREMNEYEMEISQRAGRPVLNELENQPKAGAGVTCAAAATREEQ